jgi:predicted dehydrogenase
MPRATRRQFLEESLFAAAAAATATCVTRDVSAAGQPRRAAGPNDAIRVAVIGVNSRGREHIDSLAKLGDLATIATVCDCDTAPGMRAVKLVEEKTKKAPKFEQDLRRVFDDKTIDAVTIATPNHWHALAAIWAMQAGKDVYVEKPVSHNVSEGRRIVQFARKLDRICQTGTQCRSSDGLIKAIETIRSGKLGDVKLARGLCYKSRGSIGKATGEQKLPDTVNYDLWCGPAPMKPLARGRLHYDWHWAWDTGNGDLGNQGIHQMDIARWGLGVDTISQGALGLGGRFGYEDDGETPNTHLSFLNFGDKQLIFEVRGLKTEPYRGAGVGVVFYGTEGYIVNPSYTSSTVFDRDGKVVEKFQDKSDIMVKHVRNFLDAMKSRKHTELTADIEQGHLSSALCHLGNISYRLGALQPFGDKTKEIAGDEAAAETFGRFEKHLVENGINMQTSQYTLGRRLTINPGREVFVDDTEADAMLTRNYRAPYIVPTSV